MAQDIVTTLSVETGGTEKTIKALKEEIKTLKSTLESTTIGSKSFEKASKDLAAAQAELKSVMDSTKQTVKSADGSYDALVATMAQLKKEWKATNDEVKRSEIGKQIADINNQLKDLDASIGNAQRNVGNYKQDFLDAMTEMDKGAVSYGEALAESNKSTEVTRGALEGVGQTASGVASGFAAVQGIMALCGVEGGNFEKIMVKVTSAMAIAQGIGGTKDLFEGLSKVTSAFKGAKMGATSLTTAVGGVSTGLVAAVGAFVGVAAAAIALTGNMSKLKQKFSDISAEDKAAKAAAKLNTELTELTAQTSAEKIVRIKELSSAYKTLGDDLNAKKQFVTDYKDELEEMGVKMNNVNDADNIFINNTDDYIQALMLRAKAAAIKDKATEDYTKFLQEEAELEEKLADAIAKRNAGTPDKSFWQNLGEGIIGASVYEGAPVDVVQDFNDAWTKEIANTAVDEATKALTDARNNANTAMEEAFKKAGEFDAQADAILGTPTTGGNKGGNKGGSKGNGGSTGSNANAELEEAKRIAKESSIALLTEKEKELKILETNYLQKKKLLEKYHIDTAALTEVYNNDVFEINEKYRKKDEAAEKEKDNFLKTLKIQNLDDEDQEIAKLDMQFEEYKNKFQLNKEELLVIEEWYQERLAEIRDKYREEEEVKEWTFLQNMKEDTKALIGNTTQAASAAMSSASQILSALAANQDQTNKEGFEKAKKMQIASATMNMLAGITAALSGLFTTKTGPWDLVLAGIQAATIAATGGIQIANIKKQKYDGTGGGGDTSGVGATPNIPIGDIMPIQYTRELMTDTETANINKEQKVYVLESDITETQENVAVKEANASF